MSEKQSGVHNRTLSPINLNYAIFVVGANRVLVGVGLKYVINLR